MCLSLYDTLISHITICKPIETDLLIKLYLIKLRPSPEVEKCFKVTEGVKSSVKYRHTESLHLQV